MCCIFLRWVDYYTEDNVDDLQHKVKYSGIYVEIIQP